MEGKALIGRAARLVVTFLFLAGSAWAQFSSSIQGTVTDPSGAAVGGATVQLENLVNHTTAAATTDSSGDYRFLSLAPGRYKLVVAAKGFAKVETESTLET